MGLPAQLGRLYENERIGRERAEAERARAEAERKPAAPVDDEVIEAPAEKEEEPPA